ncbi:hypothetical protein PAHAL_7G129200 [Panicum hallii]|uniref:Uncharacterized protein n=1 Tax=Panicum hallii TaxID=206008 RepID=A0A2T8IC16_9POAL|nr:hypothetical protein PAHAL_7G129200 [Panicum hallii]
MQHLRSGLLWHLTLRKQVNSVATEWNIHADIMSNESLQTLVRMLWSIPYAFKTCSAQQSY